MPCTHFDFLSHINFCRLLIIRRISRILRHNLLSFVCSICASVLASLVHEFHVDAAIGLVLDVDHVDIRVVPAGHHHAGVGGYLEVELVENVFGLVHLAELFLQVLRHVEELAGLALVPDVPYLDAQVVTRVDVIIVGGGELGPRNGVNYVGEEMLPRGVFFDHVLRGALVELRIHPQVAEADVAFGAREQEHIRPPRVVLDVGDHFGELLDVGRLQVDQVEGEDVVLQRPEIHSEVIRREEVLSVWRHTH